VASASRAAQASRDAYRVSSDGREASVPMKDHRDIVGVTITTLPMMFLPVHVVVTYEIIPKI
jgi:hypothetical protein